jgi:hypothetical protein
VQRLQEDQAAEAGVDSKKTRYVGLSLYYYIFLLYFIIIIIIYIIIIVLLSEIYLYRTGQVLDDNATPVAPPQRSRSVGTSLPPKPRFVVSCEHMSDIEEHLVEMAEKSGDEGLGNTKDGEEKDGGGEGEDGGSEDDGSGSVFESEKGSELEDDVSESEKGSELENGSESGVEIESEGGRNTSPPASPVDSGDELFGASHTTGGKFRGKAKGNVHNIADSGIFIFILFLTTCFS